MERRPAYKPLCSECEVQCSEESGSQFRQKPLYLLFHCSQFLRLRSSLIPLYFSLAGKALKGALCHHTKTTAMEDAGRTGDALHAAPDLASPSYTSDVGVVQPRVSFLIGFAIARLVCHRILRSQGRQRRYSRVQFRSNVAALVLHSPLAIKGA